MDFNISAQQREMIASVRSLAQTEFKANAMRWMDGTFPWENMKKLAHYKEISGKLAHAAGVSEQEARALAKEGKAIVWIDGGLHA